MQHKARQPKVDGDREGEWARGQKGVMRRKPGEKKKGGEERLRKHPRREDWRHAECVYVGLGLQRRKKEKLLKTLVASPCCFFWQSFLSQSQPG